MLLSLNLINLSFANTVLDKTFLMISNQGDRLGVVVDGQPYYQSTGENSSQPNTVFPFNGLKGRNGYPNWIIKPGNLKSPNEIIKHNFIDQITDDNAKNLFIGTLELIASQYPDCVTKDEHGNSKYNWQCGVLHDDEVGELFLRFFSLKDTGISYKIGTGFWSDNSLSQRPSKNLFYIQTTLINVLQAMGVEEQSLTLSKEYIKSFNINKCNAIEFNEFLKTLGAEI